MTDYTSVCFLLPQLQDRKALMELYGALAFVQATWFHTVTFSADDACKYDVCFAVNPSQIGTGLTQEWFDKKNAKTKLVVLEISNLGELVEKLRGGLGIHEPMGLPSGGQDDRDEFALAVAGLSKIADSLEEVVKGLRLRVDDFTKVANDLPSGVTVFSQCDPAWAGDAMGVQGGTIKQYGCLMCSLASILKDAGYDTDPKRLNKYLNENGGYVNGAYLSSFGIIGKLGVVGLVQPVIFTPNVVPFDLIQKTLASGGFATAMVDFDGAPHSKDSEVKMHWIRLLDDGTNCVEPWEGKIMPVAPRFGKTPQAAIWRVALYSKTSVGV